MKLRENCVFSREGAVMEMPLVLALSVAFALAATCNAATRTWTGEGGDNEWTNTLNWSDSTVPGIGDTAVFENAKPLTLTVGETSGVSHMRFLGTNITLTNGVSSSTLYFYEHGTSTVEVASGTIVESSVRLGVYYQDNIAIKKTGGGTLRHVNASCIANMKQVIVEDGLLEEAPPSAGAYTLPAAGSIHVGDGAGYHTAGHSGFYSNGGSVSLDGGTFTVGMEGVPYWWLLGSGSVGNRRPDIKVGANGATVRAVNYGNSFSDNGKVRSYSKFETASDIGEDGGIVLDLRDSGVGFMPLEPFSIKGPVTVKDGRLLLSWYGDSEHPDLSTYPSFFGTGDFTLDCSSLDYTARNDTDLPESTVRIASGAGSKMTVRGASQICFRYDTTKNFQHIVVGADGAAANSSLVRERGGALFLHDAGRTFDGEGSTVKVNGGVATNESTRLVRMPVFSENTSGGNGTISFLGYDETKGFCEFTGYATSLYAGENAVVGGKMWPALAENATAHIAALQIGEWGNLTLNPGSCLTIGNGTDPACLLLCYKTDVFGTGTIDFGTSEGVIAVAIVHADDANAYGGHRLECKLTGSGGVSYVSRSAFGRRMVSVSGENDYTGETHISVATVVARNARAFSSGDVYVDGGYRNGGKIVFDRPLTFANAFHVSGAGHLMDQWQPYLFGRGALSFLTNDVVLTGPVELVAKTTVSALPAGASGTFAGVISGDRLVVQAGEGSIVLAANNTYTGGTEIKSATVVLSGASPSVGTGRVTLDNGVLRFENTVPMTFSNDLDGVGSVEVAGADVTFASPQLADLKHKTMSSGMSFDFPQLTEHRPPSGLSIFVR